MKSPQTLIRYSLRKALAKAGDHHAYQYLLALCTGLIFWVSNAFTIGLAYEMVPPGMRCKDGQTCDYERACAEGGYSFESDSLRNMTYEWNLVCDRQYIGSIIGISNFLGIAIGSVLSSWTTNRYGRKPTCFIGMCLQTGGLFAAYFTPNPWIMCVVSCALGAGAGFSVVGAMLLQMETTDAEHRSWFVGVLYASWSCSSVIQPGLFYSLPSWRDALLPSAFISLLTYPLLCSVVESIRWLAINKSDIETTISALHSIARFNGRPGVTINLHITPQEKEQPGTSFRALFATGKLRYRMLVLSVLQVMMNLGYYGVYFAIPSYFGNIYLNGVVLGFGELIPFLISGKIIAKMPRKQSNFLTLMSSGLVLLLAWGCQNLPCSSHCVLRSYLQSLVLFLGIFLVSSYCVAVAVISTELFNSHTRGPAAGMLNAVARIGGSISTLLLLIQTHWGVPPLVIIGGSALGASLLIFTLPETLGRDMEEDCS